MYREAAKHSAILTPQLRAGRDMLSSVHAAQQRAEPCNMAIYGVSGVGKSTLIRAYKDENPVIRNGAFTHVPVASFRVPSAPTVKSLLQAICRTFDGPDHGTGSELMKRAAQYVNHFQVELLIADEAHHLIDRGRMKTHAHLGDAWKEFNDQVNCSICMCGASRLQQLFDTNTQLKNRWSDAITLRPFEYSTDQTALAQFIKTLLQRGEDDEGCDGDELEMFLLRSDVLSRFQYATDGVPALVVKLVRGVRRLRASHALNMQILDMAWNFPNSARLPPHRRPFNIEFNFSRLNGTDEPFFPSPFDGDNHALIN